MLPGAPVADAVYADLMPRIVSLVKAGHQPGLGTILVGDDSASAGYIRMKQERATSLGFSSPHIHLPPDCTQVDLETWNRRSAWHKFEDRASYMLNEQL